MSPNLCNGAAESRQLYHERLQFRHWSTVDVVIKNQSVAEQMNGTPRKMLQYWGGLYRHTPGNLLTEPEWGHTTEEWVRNESPRHTIYYDSMDLLPPSELETR